VLRAKKKMAEKTFGQAWETFEEKEIGRGMMWWGKNPFRKLEGKNLRGKQPLGVGGREGRVVGSATTEKKGS